MTLVLTAIGMPFVLACVWLDVRRRQRAGLPAMQWGYAFFWFGGMMFMLAGLGDHYAGRETASGYVVRAVVWWLGLPALAWWARRFALVETPADVPALLPCPTCGGPGREAWERHVEAIRRAPPIR